MWTVIDTPIDELRIVERDGAITAIEFAPHAPPTDAMGERDDTVPVLAAAVSQLREYFAGERTTFDLPLAAPGTDFQHSVWRELQAIPYGATASYGEIAARLGKGPGHSRAVGAANGRNPIPVVVPCHRVIGSNSTLTGFAGGLRRKQVLLDLERAGAQDTLL